jgi:hypothetical protein
MNENKTCAICGCIHEELYELADHTGAVVPMCADCAKNYGYKRCDDCGKWSAVSVTTADGETICYDCFRFSDRYFKCPDCGRIHRKANAVAVNQGTWRATYVCPDCIDNGGYVVCEHCGGYFSRNYSNTDRSGFTICDICYANHHYQWCGTCGQLVQEHNATYDRDSNRWYCDGECYETRPRISFHDYGYKPEPDFRRRTGEGIEDTLMFGVELEIDNGDDHEVVSDALADLNLPIYMKHDGSLGSEGVEIVTHPCSLAYHQYELRWAEIVRVCKANKFKSHDAGTCGLHIHVGRNPMGKTYEERRVAVGNLVILTERLWVELVKFSRRTSGQLSDWACRPNIELDCEFTDSELTDMALRTEYNGRYQACNLRNDATVEFRIFRGTLKRNTLIASIQLVSNLTKYAMTHTPTECKNATWADVVGVEQFKELNKYNTERGL